MVCRFYVNVYLNQSIQKIERMIYYLMFDGQTNWQKMFVFVYYILQHNSMKLVYSPSYRDGVLVIFCNLHIYQSLFSVSIPDTTVQTPTSITSFHQISQQSYVYHIQDYNDSLNTYVLLNAYTNINPRGKQSTYWKLGLCIWILKRYMEESVK